MKKLFRRIVRSGISEDTPAHRRDEVKLMNSLAFHSSFFGISAAGLLAILLPEHKWFMLAIGCIEMVAKASVVLLHNVQRYTVAKLIFVLSPLMLTLLLTGYFGIDTEFQYLGLVVFFSLFMIFRNGTVEDYAIGGFYLLLGTVGVTALYLIDPVIANLSVEDMIRTRLSVFVMLGALVIMMGVVLFKSNRSRLRSVTASLKEVSKDSIILNTISENMHDGIFKTHPDHGFVYVNRAFASIFGYDDDEDIMRTYPDRLYYSNADREALLQEIRSEGAVENRLLHYLHKDGSDFWGRLSCKLILEGEEEFLVGTVTDVTLQQNQDQLLKESEQQLKEAQQIAKLGNWQMEVNSRKMQWSAECERIHGYSPRTKIDAYDLWIDRLDSIGASKIETLIAKAIMTNDAVEFSSWYRTPDGERKFLVYISRYQRSRKDKGGIWYGTVQDQTEQKLTEMRISETKQFYESLLDQLPIEAVIFDDQMHFQYVSRSAIADDELREWIRGKRNVDYAKFRGLPTKFAERRDEFLAKAYHEKRAILWEECMVDRNGNDTFHIRNLFPMEVQRGNQMQTVIVGFSFNINEIKRAQFELEEKNQELTVLNKELDRFVYSMSHDLRAPIASVIGLINLALETDSKEEIKGLLEMKAEALGRLDQYIKDVIDYSRNKRMGSVTELLNMREVVEKCLSELQFFTQAGDIQFDIQVDEGISLQSDKMRLRIILNNLLSNAIKYCDPNKDVSRIQIAVYDRGVAMDIVVSDNGLGIKKEYLDRIWEMFFRGTSEGSGSGLGLYILKESVAILGGTIKVESEEGQGTTFTISLPNQEEDESEEVNSDRLSVGSSQLQD